MVVPALRPSGTKALGSERVDVVVVERRKRIDDKSEEAVGQKRVAGQDGAVHVRPPDPTGDHAVGPIPISDPSQDLASWSGVGSESSDTPVVFVARQRRKAELIERLDDQLAHRSSAAAKLRSAIEQTQTGALDAVNSREGGAEDLEAGTDREHRGAAVDGSMERAAGVELAGRQRLRQVLAAPNHVDIARVRHPATRLDPDELGVIAAPAQPLGQDDGVP
jgi:hypothetical protein